ncbi:MAG: MBL fold metallo-hydrolase [Acidobacteria bacterium]|nr:MAG: MBL fold metallo-hydrolase [Acidobacteriota bacterium]
MILDFIPVGAFQMNSYLVGCEQTGKGAIIDAGSEANRIVEMARAKGIQIEQIFQTHGHVDHVGAIKDVVSQTGARVFLHKSELPVYESAPSQGLMFGLSGIEVPVPDCFVSEGMELKVGKMTARVIETPGHTPGGVVYYFETEKKAFVGDTLFAGSIGRTDLPGGNYQTLMASLARLMLLPDDTTVYSGHGPKTTIGNEKRSNPFLQEL